MTSTQVALILLIGLWPKNGMSEETLNQDTQVLTKRVILRQSQCSTDDYFGQFQSFGQIGVLDMTSPSDPRLNSYWFSSSSISPRYAPTFSEKLCELLARLLGDTLVIQIRGRELLRIIEPRSEIENNP